MKLSKGIKIFLLAILLVFGFFGVYKIWSTRLLVVETKPESIDLMVYEPAEQVEIIPTADPKWNLYRNFKYGFQIQYPAVFKEPIIHRYEDLGRVVFLFGDASGYNFKLSIDDGITDFQEYVQDVKNRNEINILQASMIKNNFTAYRLEYKDLFFDQDTIEYVINHKDKTYSLFAEPNNSRLYLDYVFKSLALF